MKEGQKKKKKRHLRAILTNENNSLLPTRSYLCPGSSCPTTLISFHWLGDRAPEEHLNFSFLSHCSQVCFGYNALELQSSSRKSSLLCYYTHQTSLIRQQQNFINRLDIMEWACYKWALSKPYSATKWVFSVHCSHLKHHRWCQITNDCY